MITINRFILLPFRLALCIFKCGIFYYKQDTTLMVCDGIEYKRIVFNLYREI